MMNSITGSTKPSLKQARSCFDILLSHVLSVEKALTRVHNTDVIDCWLSIDFIDDTTVQENSARKRRFRIAEKDESLKLTKARSNKGHAKYNSFKLRIYKRLSRCVME